MKDVFEKSLVSLYFFINKGIRRVQIEKNVQIFLASNLHFL